MEGHVSFFLYVFGRRYYLLRPMAGRVVGQDSVWGSVGGVRRHAFAGVDVANGFLREGVFYVVLIRGLRRGLRTYLDYSKVIHLLFRAYFIGVFVGGRPWFLRGG